MECLQYLEEIFMDGVDSTVLNLVISGMPSIPRRNFHGWGRFYGFKPCYKWNAFNTKVDKNGYFELAVLNLVISGMPSIQQRQNEQHYRVLWLVLNLVISGMPSILYEESNMVHTGICFKPCYKWNAFNTQSFVIKTFPENLSFKPCYKWNAFNTPEYKFSEEEKLMF